MANSLDEMVKVAVQHQIHVKLGKETVTVIVNAQEILCVELIIVYQSSVIAHQTLIAVKRVRHCVCVQFIYFKNLEIVS